MKKTRCFLILVLLFGFESPVFASAAAQQKKMQQQRMMQQAAYQKAILQQQAAIQAQAAQQAAIQAQAAQQAAQQAAYQAAMRAKGTQAPRVMPPQPAPQHGTPQVPQPQSTYGSKVLQSGTIEQQTPQVNVQQGMTEEDLVRIWNHLKKSSQVWLHIPNDEAKSYIAAQYIQMYKHQGIVIRKSPSYYATMITHMGMEDPEFLDKPFVQVLQTAAIMEYDFDNGHDKDAMARYILGEKAYQQNKLRLGIRR